MFVHRMKTRSTFGVPRPTSGSPTSSPGRTAPASAPLQTTAVAEGPGTPGDQGFEVSPAFLKFSSHDPSAPPPRLAKGGACTALTPQSSPGKPSRGGGGVSPSSRAPRQWRRRAPALAGAVGPPARPCHGCRVPSSSGNQGSGGSLQTRRPLAKHCRYDTSFLGGLRPAGSPGAGTRTSHVSVQRDPWPRSLQGPRHPPLSPCLPAWSSHASLAPFRGGPCWGRGARADSPRRTRVTGRGTARAAGRSAPSR